MCFFCLLVYFVCLTIFCCCWRNYWHSLVHLKSNPKKSERIKLIWRCERQRSTIKIIDLFIPILMLRWSKKRYRTILTINSVKTTAPNRKCATFLVVWMLARVLSICQIFWSYSLCLTKKLFFIPYAINVDRQIQTNFFAWLNDLVSCFFRWNSHKIWSCPFFVCVNNKIGSFSTFDQNYEHVWKMQTICSLYTVQCWWVCALVRSI